MASQLPTTPANTSPKPPKPPNSSPTTGPPPSPPTQPFPSAAPPRRLPLPLLYHLQPHQANRTFLDSPNKIWDPPATAAWEELHTGRYVSWKTKFDCADCLIVENGTVLFKPNGLVHTSCRGRKKPRYIRFESGLQYSAVRRYHYGKDTWFCR